MCADLLHGRPPFQSASETGTAGGQAYLAFSLQADLRSTFSWNTKLLFVYLLAEYETPTNALNQVRTHAGLLLPRAALT